MRGAKRIAVLTSGGDAPGMNACLRGVVRAALNMGWKVYGIRDAYRGLVEGGDMIFPLDWVDVSWNFREGGTFLGSARFPDMIGDTKKSAELKRRALLNLKELGISGLIVVGGDGSLTGAYELSSYLRKSAAADADLIDLDLAIVGAPGSIDNDIAFTDMSIGADTTLNTIVECIDKLRDTAASHGRISIVEVMGRLRGYLAVMSGLATGADRVFIREEKITQSGLNNMLRVLKESFAHGQKAGVVVRSEGALFSTNFLKETISGLLEPKREVRETVLGHLQRGGNPTAFERILAMRMGVKTVQLVEQSPGEPQMAGLRENRIVPVPLEACLQKMKTPDFQGELSANAWSAHRLNAALEDPPARATRKARIGILTDGSNVSGMNMAIRAITRLAINDGMEVLGIKGGFSGLAQGPVNAFQLEWSMLEMKGVLRRAGTLLGVSGKENSPGDREFAAMEKHVESLKIDGLAAIGNETTYDSALRLSKRINLPIVGVPAALSCTLPGTDRVIGMDSALNDMIGNIDRAADAAHVLKKIFLVHVRGEYCSCLVQSAALAGGAEDVVIHDKGQTDDWESFRRKAAIKIEYLRRIVAMGKSFATIVFFSQHPDKADQALDLIQKHIAEAGIGLETSSFSLETSLGGIIPTAFDRILAQRLGEKAFTTLDENMKNGDCSFHITGISGKEITAAPYYACKEGSGDGCSEFMASELDRFITLMAQPAEACIGLGGDIEWTDAREERKWRGVWTCKKCKHSQRISFNPKKMLCVSCRNASCHNYGYIRISRRL